MQNILYKKSVLTKAVASICIQQGWYGVTNIALDTLSDFLHEYIIFLSETTKQYAELSQRTEPVLGDLKICFENAQIDTSDLLEYLLSIDSLHPPINVAKFPTPRSILTDVENLHQENVLNKDEKANEEAKTKSDLVSFDKKLIENNTRRQANIRALPEEVIQSTYEMKCFTTDDCEDNFPLYPGRMPLANYIPLSLSDNEQSDVEDLNILPLQFPQYESIAKNTEEEFKEFKLKIEPTSVKEKLLQLPMQKNKKKHPDYDPPFNVHQQKSLLKIGSRGFGRSRGRRGRRGGLSRGAANIRLTDDEMNINSYGKNRLTAGELEQTIKNKWAHIRTARVKRITSSQKEPEKILIDVVKEDITKENIGNQSDRISDINDEEIAEAADAVESPQLIFDTANFDEDLKLKFDDDFKIKGYINVRMECDLNTEEVKTEIKIESIEDDKYKDITPLAEPVLTWTDEDDDRSPVKFSPSYLNISPTKDSELLLRDSENGLDDFNDRDENDDNNNNEDDPVDNLTYDDTHKEIHLSESTWPRVYVKPLSPSYTDQYLKSSIEEHQPPLKKIKIGFSAGAECSIKKTDENISPDTNKIANKKKKKRKDFKSKAFNKKELKYDSDVNIEDSISQWTDNVDKNTNDNVSKDSIIYDESDQSEQIYDESDESQEFDKSVQWEVVREDNTLITEKNLSKQLKDKSSFSTNKAQEISSVDEKYKHKISDKHKSKDIEIKDFKSNKSNDKIESLHKRKHEKQEKNKINYEVEKSKKHVDKGIEKTEIIKNKFDGEKFEKIKDKKHTEKYIESKKSERHSERKSKDLISGVTKSESKKDLNDTNQKDSSRNKKPNKEENNIVEYEIIESSKEKYVKNEHKHMSQSAKKSSKSEHKHLFVDDKKLMKNEHKIAPIENKLSHKIQSLTSKQTKEESPKASIPKLTLKFGGATLCGPSTSYAQNSYLEDEMEDDKKSSSLDLDVGSENLDPPRTSASLTAPIKLIIKPFGNRFEADKLSNKQSEADSPMQFSPSPERLSIPSPSSSISPNRPSSPHLPIRQAPLKSHTSRIRNVPSNSSSSWSSTPSHTPSPPILNEANLPTFNYQIKKKKVPTATLR